MPISYSFRLKCIGFSNTNTEQSVLRFPEREQAYNFAMMFFEPPETVHSWAINEINARPNATYTEGVFRSL